MQLSQPLYTDTKRENTLYTHVHVRQAKKHRRHIAHIAYVSSNNHLYTQHMYKYIHIETHDKYTSDHML